MDPKTSVAFNRDAASTVNATSLSPVAKNALLTRDPAAIRDAMLREKGITPGAASAASGDIEVVLVIVI